MCIFLNVYIILETEIVWLELRLPINKEKIYDTEQVWCCSNEENFFMELYLTEVIFENYETVGSNYVWYKQRGTVRGS